MSGPNVNVPNIITERYMAELSRNLARARHSRVRYIEEWDRLLKDAVDTQAILDSAASKQLDIGQSSPHASVLERFTIFTPYTRYVYYGIVVPYARILFGGFFALASICIIWSEIIKSAKPNLSIINLTVVHHRSSDRGQIGFAGQVIAAYWIIYMCAAALISLTEVKVWRGRALVRRNTAYESAFWYAMQVAKLSVPLSYNFLTFLSPEVYEATTFYQFLGKLINLTPLGSWFDYLFPIFILVPVCATLFNLYGKVKRFIGFGDWVDDEEEDNATGYGTGGWREGRDLIERELNGHSSLGRLREVGSEPQSRSTVPNNSNSRAAPALSIPQSRSTPAAASTASTASAAPPRPNLDPQQRTEVAPEDENFFEAFGHRVRNTLDTVQKPKWMQEGIKKPKWMGGNDGEAQPSRSGSDFTRWFGGRNEDGRVRL